MPSDQRIRFDRLPTLTQWRAASSVAFGRRNTDRLLAVIDEDLEEYRYERDGNARLYRLCNLFFTTDYWLKSQSRGDSGPSGRRREAVQALYESIVGELCRRTGYAPGNLRGWIERVFGREMGHHGALICDRRMPGHRNRPLVGPEHAEYLSREEADKYRLIFRDGLAYQRPWWKPDFKGTEKPVLAESSRSPGKYHPSAGVNRAMFGLYFSGFAMSMDREIYMAPHRFGYPGQQHFFHSSYLAGATVMCTGSLRVRAGHVFEISNDSGHYRPTLDHVLNVLECLRMHGCDLARITVSAMSFYRAEMAPPGSEGPIIRLRVTDDLTRRGAHGLQTGVWSGEEVLRARGDWRRIDRGVAQHERHALERRFGAN